MSEHACAICGRVIRVGDDCYQVARGVLGTREFINLESKLLCGEECLDLATVPAATADKTIPRRRRIP
jgi:hypothetical protein